MNTRKSLAAFAVAGALVLAPVSAALADEVIPSEEVAVQTTEVETPAVTEEVIEVVPEVVDEVVPEPEIVQSARVAKVVDPTPFVLIAWPMASWIDDRHPTWPQGTKAGLSAPFTVDLATRNLDALDATLAALTVPCETSVQFQVDGNFDTQPVRNAIAGGFLNGPNDPAEALWGGGWGEAYKLVKIDGPECEQPPVIEFCTTEGTLPTATDLDPQGWQIKPERGEFVDGGLHLFSTADTSGWAQKALGVPFSQVGDLSTAYSDKTDQYTFGVILTLDGPQPDHAFGKKQIHYDEDGRYWTDQPDILGNGAVLKGGYWETYDLHADLINDVEIANIVLYVNAGHGGLIIQSQNHSCGTQPFDAVDIPTREPKDVVFTSDWTEGEPTCDVEETEQDESTVTQTRVVTTTRIPFKAIVLNGLYELIEDTEHAEIISTVVEERVLNYEGDDCDVVVPPTEEPVPPTTVVNTPDGLAYTGSNWGVISLGALAVFLMGLVVFAVDRFKKKSRQIDEDIRNAGK